MIDSFAYRDALARPTRRGTRRWLPVAWGIAILFVVDGCDREEPLPRAFQGPASTRASLDVREQSNNLWPADIEAYDNFGYAVALDGDTAVASAPGHGVGGAVYVYRWDGRRWRPTHTLVPTDVAAGQSFGSAVALQGDTLVVGAQPDIAVSDAAPGSAYVFVRDGDDWVQHDKLVGLDPLAADGFGIAVDLAGDTVVVGAPWENTVHVFGRGEDAWSRVATLVYEGNPAVTRVGRSVATDEVTIAAGGSRSAAPGIVVVFTNEDDTWSDPVEIDGEQPDDAFGETLDLDEHTLLVGAPGSNRAFIHLRTDDTWNLEQTLWTDDSSVGQFGSSVAISGDTLVVGAQASNTAYEFTRADGSWTEQARLVRSHAGDIGFGRAVAVSQSRALIAAPTQLSVGPAAGASYTYPLLPCGDEEIDIGEACDTGRVDESECDLDCTAVNCGDGHVNEAAGEECDDGNDNDNDHDRCLNSCVLATCGDGIAASFEECDDGNTDNTDDCLDTCTLARCGDGFVHTDHEACDGNGQGTPGATVDCDSNCTCAVCGDGVLNTKAGEACDDGEDNGPDGCTEKCRWSTCRPHGYPCAVHPMGAPHERPCSNRPCSPFSLLLFAPVLAVLAMPKKLAKTTYLPSKNVAPA